MLDIKQTGEEQERFFLCLFYFVLEGGRVLLLATLLHRVECEGQKKERKVEEIDIKIAHSLFFPVSPFSLWLVGSQKKNPSTNK